MTPENGTENEFPHFKLTQLISVAIEQIGRLVQEQNRTIYEKDQQLSEKDQMIHEQAQQIRENKRIMTEQGHSILLLETRLSMERIPQNCRCGGLTFDTYCRRCGEKLSYEAM